MKSIFSTLLALTVFAVVGNAQTAHDVFMNSNIKTNTNGDWNNWVHGENSFATVDDNDWNKWTFSYMGLEGTIETQSANDFNHWELNSGVTIENTDGNPNNWTISENDVVVTMSTTNWNTWVLNGAVVSGISTLVTEDFSEWKINGGDWSNLSPNFRAATVFISVISSSVLRNL